MTQPPIHRRQTGFYEPISGADLAGLDCWLAACRAEGLTERTDTSQPWHVVTMTRPITSTLPAYPVRADWPLRKGFYVWEVARSAAGDPGRLVEACRGAGIEHVAIKCHNGTYLHNGNLQPWVDACRAAFIDVWLWGYNYGNDPAGEARVAAARCEQFGVRRYIINAEHEYKGRFTQAVTWTQTFKAEASDVKLGLSSYRFPTAHRPITIAGVFYPGFPFEEFAAVCDFWAPQVYWLLAQLSTTPATQLARSIRELKAIKDIPVIPTGCAFTHRWPDGRLPAWRPTLAQLNSFDAAAQAQGCPGAAWWSFQSSEPEPDFWNTIAAHRWPPPAPAG